MRMQRFPNVTPKARIPLKFDFSGFLGSDTIASIQSVEITATVGKDATPTARLYGGASINGGAVIQWISYPVLGEDYKIVVHIRTAGGRDWSIHAMLACAEL